MINNTLNPIQRRVPVPIPSGVLPADVLYRVRRECWTYEAIERAKASTRQQLSRGSKPNPHAPKFQLQEHKVVKVETAKERTFRESWFPKFFYQQGKCIKGIINPPFIHFSKLHR